MTQQTEELGTNVEGNESIPSFPIQLVDVRLKEVHAKLVEIKGEIDERPSKVYTVGEQPPDSERFFGTLGLEARLVLSDDEMLELSVTVEGAFKFASDSEQEEEGAIEAFQERDLIPLLWPYLREQVHSITHRMRLGVPPLPLVDVRTLVEDEGT